MDNIPNSRPNSPTALADGALAAAVLALAVAVVVVFDISVSPSAILVGVVATVVFEILAGRDVDRVRAVWARPAIRTTTVAVSLAGGILAVVSDADWFVVAGTAALGCYLVFLVVSGVLAPPGS